jgi:integrase
MQVRPLKNQAGEIVAFTAYAGKLNGNKRRKRFSVKKFGGLALAQTRAEAWVRAKAKQIDSNATFGALIDERLLSQVSEAVELLSPYRISLIEAVRGYVAGQTSQGRSQSAPIRAWTWSEATDAFLENLRHGGRSKDYIRDCEIQYAAFARDFGTRSLDEITTEGLQAWVKARKLSVTTRNNWRRDLGMVWRFAIGRGRAAANPAALLPRGLPEDGPIAILTPTEAELALRTAEKLGKRNYIVFLALSCFAGLRTIEVKRLLQSNIEVDRRIITVNTRVSKTRQRRIPIISENLACWLECYQGQRGNKVLEQGGGYMKVMRRALKEAGGPTIPPNAMRHSWFSYHLALGQNEHRTQLEGGHQSAEVLYKNYRELVTPDAARAWFAIFPSSSPA